MPEFVATQGESSLVEIMEIIEKRDRLTNDGLTNIVMIASKMNVRKNRVFLESSETMRRTSRSSKRTTW